MLRFCAAGASLARAALEPAPRSHGSSYENRNISPAGSEQIDLAGDRRTVAPADPDSDPGREAVVVERDLVLVLALVAVEDAGRPFGVQRLPSAPAVEPLPAEGIGARLAERVGEDRAAPDEAVGSLALEAEQHDRLVIRVGREVHGQRREHRPPLGDFGRPCGAAWKGGPPAHLRLGPRRRRHKRALPRPTAGEKSHASYSLSASAEFGRTRGAVACLLAALATALAGCAWLDGKDRTFMYRPTPGRSEPSPACVRGTKPP